MPCQPYERKGISPDTTADFDCFSTTLSELVEQRIHLQRRQMVPVRMRQHGVAARATDPSDRVPERDPSMGDVTGLTRPQILLERSIRVRGVALLNQEAGEVAAAQNHCVTGKPGGASQTVRDTCGAELLRDECGTNSARHANLCQTFGEHCVACIDTESEHMHGQACPSDRNFDSRHEADAGLASRGFRFGQPTDFVMVGEREHGDPVVRRTPDQRRWSQHSIGIRGVAV